MFEWTTFLADLVVIGGVVYAIRRWRPFKWWLTLGYWFNAQAWGARDNTLPYVEPSCWGRALPAPVCRVLASFFLLKVESPPESEGVKAQLDHQMGEVWDVIESWKRITARHERRSRHPRYCYNPTNRRWCCHPNCDQVATGRVIRNFTRTSYYCSEHHPMAGATEDEDDYLTLEKPNTGHGS